MNTINGYIIYFARKFLGQKEISGNLGFQDERFEQLMKEVGWQKGQAWCAYFIELIWKHAYFNYDKSKVKILDKLFSAGAVKTFNNFMNSELFKIGMKPEPGAIVIWQYYKNNKPHWSGHAGIVIDEPKQHEMSFLTIEGNTNSKGGREGIEVAKKIRTLNFEPKRQGLVLKGFIYPEI